MTAKALGAPVAAAAAAAGAAGGGCGGAGAGARGGEAAAGCGCATACGAAPPQSLACAASSARCTARPHSGHVSKLLPPPSPRRTLLAAAPFAGPPPPPLLRFAGAVPPAGCCLAAARAPDSSALNAPPGGCEGGAEAASPSTGVATVALAARPGARRARDRAALLEGGRICAERHVSPPLTPFGKGYAARPSVAATNRGREGCTTRSAPFPRRIAALRVRCVGGSARTPLRRLALRQ